jgi:rubrerythrin
MFPDRKRKTSSGIEQEKEYSRKKRKSDQVETKIFKKINLEFKYHKPIVLKCESCGNTIPNFVKKCPFCNKPINY